MSDAAAPIDGRSVNRAELTSICGVTVVTIDASRQKGCRYIERGGRGKGWIFDTAAVIDWRLQHGLRGPGVSSRLENLDGSDPWVTDL